MEDLQRCINTYNAELTLIVFICVQSDLEEHYSM